MGQLGAKLSQVGAKLSQLGPSWTKLGPSWAKLGPTWGQVEAKLGQVGAKLGQVGPQDDPKLSILGRGLPKSTDLRRGLSLEHCQVHGATARAPPRAKNAKNSKDFLAVMLANLPGPNCDQDENQQRAPFVAPQKRTFRVRVVQKSRKC